MVKPTFLQYTGCSVKQSDVISSHLFVEVLAQDDRGAAVL